MPRFRHATPSFRTFCGDDALSSLPRELDRLGASRAVIFCGSSMARHEEALKRVESAVGGRLAGRFSGVREHSPIQTVEAAHQLLKDLDADAVIAVGGGSAVVTARAATILLAENRDIRELCTRRGENGKLVSPRLSAPKIPQWVVPSTPTTAYAKAGSAVRDPSTGERLALFDPKARANGVFLDPVVATTSPVSLVRASALNALSMAVDGLQADADDPLADALLSHALRMLVQWLPRLNADPDAPEPRLRLMLAALLSGQGSDYVGAGLAQALSHAVGPRTSTSNGVVEAMLLPHTMRYNEPVTGTRMAAIGDVFGAASAAAAVREFIAELGVPTQLREVGLAREVLAEVVDHAMDDWAITQVPRPADRDELLELLDAAW